jgi:hypothetical protein
MPYPVAMTFYLAPCTRPFKQQLVYFDIRGVEDVQRDNGISLQEAEGVGQASWDHIHNSEAGILQCSLSVLTVQVGRLVWTQHSSTTSPPYSPTVQTVSYERPDS